MASPSIRKGRYLKRAALSSLVGSLPLFAQGLELGLDGVAHTVLAEIENLSQLEALSCFPAIGEKDRFAFFPHLEARVWALPAEPEHGLQQVTPVREVALLVPVIEAQLQRFVAHSLGHVHQAFWQGWMVREGGRTIVYSILCRIHNPLLSIHTGPAAVAVRSAGRLHLVYNRHEPNPIASFPQESTPCPPAIRTNPSCSR